jgi:NAD(P)-dependent dehydrogenase (short-subunit alcohol dehydrogenase family)
MTSFPLPNFLLQNQIAVVTGGGSGIGRAVALTFAAAGARVVVLDAHEASAAQVVDEIGITGQAVVADVRDAEAIERVFAEVASRYGRIDVLFKNAGINRRHPSLEMTLDDWNAVIAVNITGMFICARTAVRHMVTGGRIVNTASMLGLSGGWYPNIAYQATKGAVVNMTRSWAIEWAPLQIRVNAVAPGLVRTPFIAGLTDQPDLVDKFEQLIPLGRLAEVDDITGPVLFLASPASAMVTGHILLVDGGMLAQ